LGGGGAAGRRCVRLVGGQWALYVAELTLARAGGGEDKKARSPGHRRRRTLEQGRPPTGVQRRVSPKHKPWCAGGWGSLRICTLRAIGVWEVGGELRHTCLQTSRYRALCTLRAGPLWARQMGIPTSVSIGSMVNLPPTARSEDYVGACNCKYLSREKPRNRYIFDRGAWGDVCASRRGVVFLLYLAFIDRVKDSDHYIFDRGAWGDVCASRRGAVFLLYLAFIDCVKDSDHYIFDRGAWGDVCASRRGVVFLL
jgi:hypothetical protein